MLVGRDRELSVLEGLLRQGSAGVAGTVLLQGEPGIGKTALLDELAARSGRARTLRTQGAEVEAPLAFAALHRLLRPIMRLRDELPGPQARALQVAFGEQDGAVEPFLVGVAVLGLIAAAAEEQLLVCMVDDVQWLDPASADALLFTARRLGADRVVLVFAVRDGVQSRFDDQGLNEMRIAGLDDESARKLLDSAPIMIRATDVSDRLVADTRGNPLALLEIPTELTAAQLDGTAPLPSQLHLTARVEQAFLGRIRRQPQTVQAMLLIAAADDAGQVSLLSRAAAELRLPEDTLEEAARSKLLTVDERTVALRHPLVRTAIYQAATRDERRRVHLALATALDESGEADRATWHRALAAEGPDEDLAAELERVGARAQRRGAPAAALSAFARAASLCPDPHVRAALLFAAAGSAWNCGRVAHATTLLSEAAETNDDVVLMADVARLRAHIEVNVGSAAAAHRIASDAARAVLPVDPLRALELGVVAATLRAYGADSGVPLRVDELLMAASDDVPPRTRCLQAMFTAMTLTADGRWSGAVDALNRALLIGEEIHDREVLWNLGNAALQLGDDQAQMRCYTRALADARASGSVTAVVYALQRLCFSYLLAGDLAAVRNGAEEALSLTSSIGQAAMATPLHAWLTLLAALEGRADYAGLRSALEGSDHPARGIFADPVHDLTQWADGIRAASAGDRAGAIHHLSRFRVAALHRMAAVDRFEAAVHADQTDLARTWTDELATFADATGRAWAKADTAYGRAIGGDSDTDTDADFLAALDGQTGAGRPLEQARIELAYGEWLRRIQRRVDSRRHLRFALDQFRSSRAEPFAERAAEELRASGESARRRDVSTTVQLTPMEIKIAGLVRSGMSNKDVAAECWVSPRTVAFHLRNVFTKAGITSRTELARVDFV
jgi:DNA-binding CsgD family transcriptional regulator